MSAITFCRAPAPIESMETTAATPKIIPSMVSSEQSQPRVAIKRRKPVDRRSRPQRWNDALAEMLALQAEYAAGLDVLPDSLRDGATAVALQAIVDLDLDALAEIEPPRGFGRSGGRQGGCRPGGGG